MFPWGKQLTFDNVYNNMQDGVKSIGNMTYLYRNFLFSSYRQATNDIH